MKKLNKLQINSEKLIKNEDLVTLKGGYGDPYYWICVDGIGECGCISTVTNDQYVASFYCGWFTGCSFAWGPFGSMEGEGCYIA